MNKTPNVVFAGLFLAVASLCSGAAAAAEELSTPTELKGGKIVSAEEAKKLLDAKAATFVDTRSIVNFGKGHLPGAVTASYKEKSEKSASFDAKLDSFELDKLPKDKSAPLVIYSDGPTGWKSYKAAVLSINAGHTKVHYLRGGFSDWTAKNLPVEH